jgi:hypothetical protein
MKSKEEKQRDSIHAYLNNLDTDLELLANMLTLLPGNIQFRLWQLVMKLVKYWAKSAQYQMYDTQYTALYKWAERVDRENVTH